MLALRRRKQMHDHVAQIDQYPAALCLSINILQQHAPLGDLLARFGNRIRQGFELAITGTTGDDKIIGEDGHAGNFHQNDVLTLFVFDNVYYFSSE